MRVLRGIALLLVIAAAAGGRSAGATGIAGDRLFPSTLTVEDTQNDDELDLPTVALLRRGANGDMPAGRDLGIRTGFSRLLTPDLAFTAGAGWRRIDAAAPMRAGWDNVDVGLKYRTLVNEPHEFLLSTAVDYEIGGTGARRIGAERFDTVQPIVSFGKGFGDLPREVDWLRPVAITGAAGLAVPTGSGPKLLRYGATLQYSLLYRDQHTALATPPWLTRLVPLVEFAVESPVGRSYGSRTVATAAPGVAWIGEKCQLTAEMLVPLNGRTGRGVGVIAQLHLFLDELMPSVFGQPIFGADKGGESRDRD
jgi:hypothetical protein